MKLIGLYLVIEPIAEQVVTDGGLIIPGEMSDHETRYRKATVFEIGDEVTKVQKDDVIYYDKAQAFLAIIEGRSLSVILQRDVFCVL